jgi:hypothetical protein
MKNFYLSLVGQDKKLNLCPGDAPPNRLMALGTEALPDQMPSSSLLKEK